MKRFDVFLMGLLFILIGMSLGGAIYPLVAPHRVSEVSK